VYGQGILRPLDATVFHTFLIDVVPGVREDIFIDGGLLYSGPAPASGPNVPILLLGNQSSFQNIAAEITEFEVRQGAAIAEPSALLAVLTALPGLMLVRRRRIARAA
jgi:hypothetical protein